MQQGQVSLYKDINGLVQDRSNSSALAMELLQSCIKSSISTVTMKTTPITIKKMYRNAIQYDISLIWTKYLILR